MNAAPWHLATAGFARSGLGVRYAVILGVVLVFAINIQQGTAWIFFKRHCAVLLIVLPKNRTAGLMVFLYFAHVSPFKAHFVHYIRCEQNVSYGSCM
jgi:hypothetical protein